MNAKAKPNRAHNIGWVEQGDLRGVKGGDESDQVCIDHLADVHTEKTFFSSPQANILCHPAIIQFGTLFKEKPVLQLPKLLKPITDPLL